MRRLPQAGPEPMNRHARPVALAAFSALACTAAVQAQDTYPAASHGGSYMRNYLIPPAPSSTPWAPAWSPDGTGVAVSMQGSIWSIDVRNGAARELTYDPGAYHASPDWSPDGRWLVYVADEDGRRTQLEVQDMRSGVAHRLVDDEQVYLDPVFSPDGSRVAYVSTEPSGFFNVYVRAFENGEWSGDPIAVTRDHDYPADRLYFGPHDMHLTPAWMPDGNELLLVSNRDTPLGSGNVLRVPVRGDGIGDAVTVLAEQTLYRTRPDVSPDGKRFIYSSTSGTADQFHNLYLQPTVGGEPYKLTFYENDAFHPRWSPDGEQIAFVTNAGGLPRLALLETYGGRLRTLDVSSRAWKRPVGAIEVDIRSAETGERLPARVILEASDGKFYAPDNAYARIGHVGDHLFHADGGFRATLPAGEGTFTVSRGFETLPVTVPFTVEEGRTRPLTVTLEAMADSPMDGCYSGSTHVHMNYSGHINNTLANLAFMSRAEDQDILNEQIANKDNRVLDHQFFVPGGGAHPTSTPGHVVVVGQEYRPPFYGHVFMLGLEEHLISPFLTGYEGTAIESLFPSNTDMLLKAKAQGATTGYVHPFVGDADPLQGSLGGAKGFMVDAALGATDALEWSLPFEAGFYPLYAVWNNGLKVTAVGGEDSITDLPRWRIMGSVRTYVCTDDGRLSAEAWYRGLRDGRALVTTGPLIRMSVDGVPVGETLVRESGDGPVTLRATIRSIVPLRNARVIINGETVHEAQFEGARTAMDLEVPVDVQGSSWIHVRVDGDAEEGFPLDVRKPLAFTNPVWIEVDGRPVRSAEAADYGIQWIDKLRGLAEQWPGWRAQAEKDHVFEQFDRAADVYRAFKLEAAEATRPSNQERGDGS